MRKKRYLHQLYRILGVTFGMLVLGCLFLLLIAPNPDYSEKEKRYLADAPKLSLSTLASGAFMEQTEDYAKDRFPLRDAFVSLKVNLDRLFLKKESQGVYYLKDHTLAERFTSPDNTAFRGMIQAVRDFSGRSGIKNQYFLLAPTAAYVKKDLLPANALTDDEDAYISAIYDSMASSVEAVDLRPVFEEAKEDTKLYYASDHHWTSEGAYLAAKKLLKTMGIEDLPAYESGVVLNDFSGSLTAKSGFTLPVSDSISVYKEKDSDIVYTVTYEKEHRMSGTVYVPKALYGTDPYQVFFGGNYPEITINTSADTDRQLLVLKDSYANALLPFLIPHFSKIKIIDPRYAYDDIDVMVKEADYTDILYLYNAVTLSEDTSLTLFLKGEVPGEAGKQGDTDPGEDPSKGEEYPSSEGHSGTEDTTVSDDESESADTEASESDSQTSGEDSSGSGPENTETPPAESQSENTDPIPSDSEPENTDTSPSEDTQESSDATLPPETEPARRLTLNECVFVGDSRTVFMGSQVINGVAGSQVMDDSRLFATYGGTLADATAQDNASRASQVQAPVAFFWYGVNDVQIMPDRDDADAFLQRYSAMVEAYRANSPGSRIIILSVANTSVNEKDYYPGQEENIARYNAALSAYAAASGFNYIDVTPLVSESSFLPDNIHFTNAFYQQLMPYLQDQLTQLTTP